MLQLDDPNKLWDEIGAAERLRDAHLRTMQKQVDRYVGPFWKSDGAGEFQRENHIYEYISLMVPRLIHDNPKVRLKSRRPGPQDLVAEALEHALNRWSADSNLRDTLVGV